MFHRFYKTELIARAFHENSLPAALGLTCRMARSWLWGHHRIIYALDHAQALGLESLQIAGFEVQGLLGWDEVHRELYEPLKDELRHLPTNPKVFCQSGACFWIGRLDGKIASFGMSRIGSGAEPYFLPIQPAEAVLSHFVTLPEYRGRSLYRAMLIHIMQSLTPAGIDRFLLDCNDWNVASCKTVERVGFTPIGHGVINHRGKMTWQPLAGTTSPDHVPV